MNNELLEALTVLEKEKDISKQKITPIMSGNICVTADDMTSAKTSKNELYVSADAAFPDKEIIKV